MSDDNQTPDGDNPTDNEAPTESWIQSLPDDLKSEPALGKFSNIEALAKSYVNAERLIGRDKIPMPQTDDDWRSTYQRLGMPETPDKYELNDIEWEDGFKKPETDIGIRDFAHQNGLSNKQADAVNKFYYDNLLNMAKSTKDQRVAASEETFKKAQSEMGEAFKGNIELAKRVISEYADDSTKEFLESSGLGNDINLLKVFSKIGGKLVEDRVLEGDKPSGMAPTEIETEIKKLQAHPAYLDNRNPEHKVILGQMEDLFNRLHPEES